MSGFTRVLRSRNYRLYFSGQLISLTGTWMQSVAQSWLVYRLTGSTTMLGVIGFCSQMPAFILGPVGGTVADRLPRRRILVAAQTASMVLAFVLAALTLSERITVSHLIVLSTLLGVVTAFELPARQAFIGEMVAPAHLTSAIGLNASMVNGTRIVGPAVAGLVVAAIGEGWCFFLNGASFLAVIAGLLAMTGLSPMPPRAPRSPIADIVEGFGFVLGNAPVRVLMLLLGAVSLLVAPYTVLMPVFADRILGGGARTLGLLTGAAGAGALAGALALALRKELKGIGRWIMLGTIGVGLALCGFAWSRHLALSCVLLALVGCAQMIQMAGTNTLIQMMSPPGLRGRVMAVYGMMFMGMAPLGALAAGWLAKRLDAPLTVTIGGVICVLAGLAFSVRLPALRVGARALVRGAGTASSDLAQESAGDAGVR
jgi:MFS family permease